MTITTAELTAMADGTLAIPSEPVDVSRYEEYPLVRKLTRVFWESRNGSRWLRWEWTKAPITDRKRTVDCGFSAISDFGAEPADTEPEPRWICRLHGDLDGGTFCPRC